MIGKACTETVVGEGGIAGQGCGVNVAVAWGDIPVGVVGCSTMSEELKGGDFPLDCLVGWEA